jgi:excisionase family DNA binding protein
VDGVERQWLSYQEITKIYGISRGTVWKLISAGEIRAAKIGRAVRISRNSIEEYLSQQNYAEKVRS